MATAARCAASEAILTYLLVTSLIWAFSFGLIKTHLSGYDPLVVALARLSLSATVFLPWLRITGLGQRAVGKCLVLGAVQFGAMYWLYIAAYGFLPAYGIAVLTIFTPLYVVMVEGLWERRLACRHVLGALLAVAGAALGIARTFPLWEALFGILLVQGSNLCFAAGQIGYRRLFRDADGRARELSLLAWMYVGAAAFVALAALAFADFSRVRLAQGDVWVLLYLGVVPTGVGFYLWNKGAARTSPGVLATANNLKIPLAVLLAWLVFGESAPYERVLAGLSLIFVGLAITADSGPFARTRSSAPPG